MINLDANQKKMLGVALGIFAFFCFYSISMVSLFKQPPPIEPLAPYLAVAGSAVLAWLGAVQVYKSLK